MSLYSNTPSDTNLQTQFAYFYAAQIYHQKQYQRSLMVSTLASLEMRNFHRTRLVEYREITGNLALKLNVFDATQIRTIVQQDFYVACRPSADVMQEYTDMLNMVSAISQTRP